MLVERVKCRFFLLLFILHHQHHLQFVDHTRPTKRCFQIETIWIECSRMPISNIYTLWSHLMITLHQTFAMDYFAWAPTQLKKKKFKLKNFQPVAFKILITNELNAIACTRCLLVLVTLILICVFMRIPLISISIFRLKVEKMRFCVWWDWATIFHLIFIRNHRKLAFNKKQWKEQQTDENQRMKQKNESIDCVIYVFPLTDRTDDELKWEGCARVSLLAMVVSFIFLLFFL